MSAVPAPIHIRSLLPIVSPNSLNHALLYTTLELKAEVIESRKVVTFGYAWGTTLCHLILRY